MSRTHYGACVVLWIFSLVACKVPEVRVTCIFSKDCILPCSFTPTNGDVKIQWFQQEALIFSLQPAGQRFNHGNMSLFSDSVSEGNASLLVKQVDTRSKGRYKCVVNNVTVTYVVATVEAPIRTVSIDINPSGLIQCSTKDVYPAPLVQWSTEPRLSHALQPITRMAPGGKSLFTVESILKQQNNSLDYIYVCNITSKYGTHTRTASLQLQEITGSEGKDLVIPCKAPKKLQSFSLVWTFTTANKTTDILTYDSRTHKSRSLWDNAELEEDNALKGDVSLTLENTVGSEHSGFYTCAFSGAETRHLIQSRVVITSARQEKDFVRYNLWMLGIVAGLIALLALTLVVKRYRAKSKRNQESAQEDAEMQRMNPDKTSEEPQAGNKLMTQPSASHS
uniref:HERV-H LTR-associating 2a, tandem duplicate 1 n=2 Tax=Sinocyclocheilus rhinocerous TaxID=307959 RepID=A0A673FH38_9TELE